MLRLISIITMSTCAGLGAENDLASLLQHLEKAPNPFVLPANAVDNSGLQGIYAALGNASGALYGENCTGSIMFEGMPWSTGDVRTISAGGGRTPARFSNLTPPSGEHPGIAVFHLGESQQEVSVEIPAANLSQSMPAVEGEPGWILSPTRVIAAGATGGTRVMVKTGACEESGRVAARSGHSGLTLIVLDHPTSWHPLRSAPADYCGEAIVVPLDGSRSLRVPSGILSSPCAHQELRGALVVTPAGALLGILGQEGIVPAADLEIPEVACEPVGTPDARLVLISTTPAK